MSFSEILKTGFLTSRPICFGCLKESLMHYKRGGYIVKQPYQLVYTM